jgi:hypothetical protein
VADLHVWRLGPGHLGIMAVVVSHNPLSPTTTRRAFRGLTGYLTSISRYTAARATRPATSGNCTE